MEIGSDTVRALLLRQLPDTEAVALREQVLLDAEFAAKVQEAEHALLDDYVRGVLPPEERARVEEHLLATPSDRVRLAFTRALRTRRPRNHAAFPWLRLWRALPVRGWAAATALAAAVIAAIAIGVLVFPERKQPVATLTLLAEAARGISKPRPLEIPAHGRVRLQAEVVDPPSGARYTLVIRAVDGRRLYAAAGLAVQQAGPFRYVEAEVPASALGPGARRVEVSGPGFTFTWDEQGRR